MSLNDKELRHLETLVTGIKDISGCRIILDPDGNVREIHVTAVSERPPRLIARDVDTLLKVKAGLEIDHRIIGVVIEKPVETGPDGDAVDEPGYGGQVDPDIPAQHAAPAKASRPLHGEGHAADEEGITPDELDDEFDDELFDIDDEAAGEFMAGEVAPLDGEEDFFILEDDDEDRRVLYRKMSVTHEDGRVHAEVALSLGDRYEVGEGFSADTPDGHLAAVIQATLQGLMLLHEPEMDFAEPIFRVVSCGREDVLLVHLSAVESRNVFTFAGAAIIRQDPRQAAVLATLGALNRQAAFWPLREDSEFDII